MLEPTLIFYSLHDPREDGSIGFATWRGEIKVQLDGPGTAFIWPCHRITMSERVQQLLIEVLEPLGVKYMRWWNDGHIIGRTFGEATL